MFLDGESKWITIFAATIKNWCFYRMFQCPRRISGHFTFCFIGILAHINTLWRNSVASTVFEYALLCIFVWVLELDVYIRMFFPTCFVRSDVDIFSYFFCRPGNLCIYFARRRCSHSYRTHRTEMQVLAPNTEDRCCFRMPLTSINATYATHTARYMCPNVIRAYRNASA